ncbi:MAG: hypothetical protein PHF46_03215 [Candidatus Gracilibacteria bacterium]|nr:hypothetical protein [Candidatus Gracilibacteria bacterium]MDD3120389.1 hypothetical protein [Candidatus Gracilibacteria bacterium]MDD4530499.1 hypothetical protein [Candidatus Gracilibacteria bacterium]
MQNNKGFSSVIAIIMTAILLLITVGILDLYVSEGKINKIVFSSISSYAGAEGALEYALLKIKNHREGFEDKITKEDYDSKLLAENPGNINKSKDNIISYEIESYAKDYSGSIASYQFEIIPLFFDEGKLIQKNSKNYSSSSIDITKTIDFKLTSPDSLLWNIIGNNTISGETVGISGTGKTINKDSIGFKKEFDTTSGVGEYRFTFAESKIGDFIDKYENNYLILYNPLSTTTKYNIISNEGFSLPGIKIIASGETGTGKLNFRQNIGFEKNKSDIFELLKYSIFNK